MELSSVLVLALNGLASTTPLFLISCGLTLIFGVTRIVNFAHGSFYMLGLYIAFSLVNWLGADSVFGFWGGVLLSAIAVGLLGLVVEVVLLRRIYGAPDLYQLLATFALVYVIKDAALYIWGPNALLGARAPGLTASVHLFGADVPSYGLLLAALGPVLLAVIHIGLVKTKLGTRIRAAAQDREMVGALGVNEARLFATVLFIGSFLAGLGGALELPRESARLTLDLSIITDAFVVMVVGGLGSIRGAYIAALLISAVKALCIGIGDVSLLGVILPLGKLTQVWQFIIMVIVLTVKPTGLFGIEETVTRNVPQTLRMAPFSKRQWGAISMVVGALCLVPVLGQEYTQILLIDILIFGLFSISLQLLLGHAGIVSFGHAAYFGLGAYLTGLLIVNGHLSLTLALLLGVVGTAAISALFGWFCIRASGVSLAMLTLALAQIVWSIFYQVDGLAGGSNGLIGIDRPAVLENTVSYFYFVLALTVLAAWGIWHLLHTPMGYGFRAARDSTRRAEASGIPVKTFQLVAFVIAAVAAALAGGLFALGKGAISPQETLGIGRSVDPLLMTLLGGLQTRVGPVIGSAVITWLSETLRISTEYWQMIFGLIIIGIVVLMPDGIVGSLDSWRKKHVNRSKLSDREGL